MTALAERRAMESPTRALVAEREAARLQKALDAVNSARNISATGGGGGAA